MAPSTQPNSASITSYLVLALIIILLVGAVLVRFIDVLAPQSNKDLDAAAPPGKSDAVAAAAADGSRASGSAAGIPREGFVAPDLTLPDLDGRSVSLSDWRGKPVLINFWATWCGPCEVEMPIIEAAYQEHQEDGFVVLAVAVDDSETNVRRFFDKQGLTILPLIDDGTAARAYQVFGLPTSFFIGSDGKIAAVHTGLLTKDKLEQYVMEAKAQE